MLTSIYPYLPYMTPEQICLEARDIVLYNPK